MMARKLATVVCLAAAVLVWLCCSGEKPAEDEKSAAETPPAGAGAEDDKLPIKQTGEHTYELDGITIDTAAKQVRFAAAVNQTDQELPLEVLVCTNFGKTHEALLRTTVSPTYLNVALTLIGCHGGKSRAGIGRADIPVGSPVEIELKWTNAEGQTKTLQPEAWVWNNSTKAPMRETRWTYTGSMFHMDKFMAEQTGTIINLYTDPSTLIEPPIPEVADDTAFGVHEKAVPPTGTPVEIIITALPEKEPADDKAKEGGD